MSRFGNKLDAERELARIKRSQDALLCGIAGPFAWVRRSLSSPNVIARSGGSSSSPSRAVSLPAFRRLRPKPPVGPQWIHEIKHDGYRPIARRHGNRVRLFTRRGYDWADRYPLITKAMAALPRDATIDDEARWDGTGPMWRG